jgi:hypothetical protein
MTLRHLLPITCAIATACPEGGSDDEAGDDTGGACETPSEVVVDDVPGIIALAVSGTRIAYVIRESLSVPTTLAVIELDGGSGSDLYTSALDEEIVSLAWAGADLVFLQTLPGATESAAMVIPGTGGTPMQLGTGTFQGAERIVGTDADAAYVLFNAAGGAAVDRVALSDGAVTRVGTISGSGTGIHPVLAGGDIFVQAGPAGGTDPGEVYRLGTGDTDAEAEVVGAIGGHEACGFPLGGLAATPTRLVCGFADVATFARADGAPEATIVEGGSTDPHIVVGSSGERVFMIQRSDGVVAAQIQAVDAGGGDIEVLACDARKVADLTLDGFFPNQAEYQFAVADGAVVWAQETFAEGETTATWSIRRAAF